MAIALIDGALIWAGLRLLGIPLALSVAYLFVHLLPELGRGQATVEQAVESAFGFLEHHVYLVALLGLVVFYGLERAAKLSRHVQRRRAEQDRTSAAVFWLHMVSFALYNALIGYLLLHREQPGLASLGWFFIAMAMHFLVNDFGLREDHKDAYHDLGRWILTGAVFLGWAVGYSTHISDLALAVLVAFLAGEIILNTLKEELPAERESRFSAFLLGAGVYAGLLLTL